VPLRLAYPLLHEKPTTSSYIVKKHLISWVESVAPSLAALWRCRHLFTHPDSYLRTTGYLTSLQRNLPVAATGQPLPFLNYPTLALLKSRLRPDLKLLEFGSGYSTAFFSRHVGSVTSVEHEAGWLERVRQLVADQSNVTLLHRPLGLAYSEAAATAGGPFHLILVDGRQRHACALASLPFLSPDGVLIWDDSSRERYQPGIAEVQAAGFRALRLEGLKPAGLGTDETTLLYRDGNCLGL